jgi:methylase of polypeptide subunit release factors
MNLLMKPHLAYAQAYWQKWVAPGDLVIDATVGNGHDSFFLAQLLKGQGSLTGYDIQPQAIESAKKRLEELPFLLRRNISLKLQSHVHFEEKNAKLIVYNLGYLPGGNKTVTTLSDTTLQSLQKALLTLSADGAVSITCYPGHEEGRKEEAAIMEFLKMLPATQWSVCIHQWINRSLAPSLIWLHRA